MYMLDGRMVDVIADDVNGKVLVAPIFEAFKSTGGDPDDFDLYSEEVGDSILLIDKSGLFDNPPIEKYNEEIKNATKNLVSIVDKIRDKGIELRKLESEIASAAKGFSKSSEFIFDMSAFRTAKRFVFWAPDRVYPFIISQGSYLSDKDVTLRIEISCQYEGNVVRRPVLSYKVDRDWNSNVVDSDYGVLFDPTDEEIVEKTKARCDTLDFSKVRDWDFLDKDFNPIHPQYLSEKGWEYVREAKAIVLSRTSVNLRAAVEKAEADLKNFLNKKS